MVPAPASDSGGAVLRTAGGHILPLPGDRWLGPAQAADLIVLGRVDSPVLDIGCGPGRHIEALSELGKLALGIDLSGQAVDVCRQKGLSVLERSVFDAIPRAGHWGGALLMDGNIGIGADPALLLNRVTALLRPGACVVVEVQPQPQTSISTRVRLELGEEAGPWFDWVDIDEREMRRAAAATRLEVIEVLELDDRLFGVLRTPSIR